MANVTIYGIHTDPMGQTKIKSQNDFGDFHLDKGGEAKGGDPSTGPTAAAEDHPEKKMEKPWGKRVIYSRDKWWLNGMSS